MAEGALGIAFGGLGLLGLFTACVECFEMIENGTNYARDLEILYTGYEAQRVRFIIWGEAVGVGDSQNALLDRPHIRAAIERGLNCIKMLFDDGAILVSKYGLQRGTENSVSHSLVFRDTYRRFRERITASQTQAPLIQTTKWAIRNKTKFQVLVSDLRTLIDDLESITWSAETVRRRQAIVDYEIASINDEHSLRLLEGSDNVDTEFSDAVSSRLREIRDNPNSPNVEQSSAVTTFWSACSNILTVHQIDRNHDTAVAAPHESQGTTRLQNERLTHRPSNWQVPSGNATQLQLFDQSTVPQRQPVLYSETDPAKIVEDLLKAQMPRASTLMLRIVQRLVAGHEEKTWRLGLSRIDEAARALICFFEGPQDSPYEGGIFYLRLFISKDFPFKPPVCQLLTRIYHPYFDSRGRVCLDVLYGQWSPVLYVYGTLVSVASLLDDVVGSDPLVPEIAAQYTRDRATFNKTAREYTVKYATSNIPDVPIMYGDKPWWEAVRISS